LLNQLLIAAIAFNIGSFFAGGTYEVVWSLYLTSLGASLGAIGLTFLTFALPILVLSPVAGRFIDREGGFLALVGGMAGVAICGVLYPLIPEVWFVVALGIVEGTAFALASPALYLLVARASPPGRSSTAQGIFGAAGTMGTIVASLSAGILAERISGTRSSRPASVPMATLLQGWRSDGGNVVGGDGTAPPRGAPEQGRGSRRGAGRAMTATDRRPWTDAVREKSAPQCCSSAASSLAANLPAAARLAARARAA
jgi:MFS family permease